MKLKAPIARSRSKVLLVSIAAVLGGVSAGCAPPDVLGESPIEETPSGIVATNGIRVNGIRVNGIRVNGIRVNGIRVNGIRVNGIRVNGIRVNGIRVNGLIVDSNFASWFNGSEGGDRATHAETMKYLSACALKDGENLTFVDDAGAEYTWPGSLGLAPLWFDQASTTTENQFVSACLGAHANTALPEPKHVQISVRGDAPGLATTPAEEKTLSTYDGTFFGDLFAPTAKMYICRAAEKAMANYIPTLLKKWGRECYFTNDGCEGAFEMVDCASACATNPTLKQFGKSCTVDGTTYKPIHVFVPRIWTAAGATATNGVTKSTCSTCVGGFMAKLGASTSSSISLTDNTMAAGQYVLEVRYANGGTAPVYVRVKTGSRVVMNGTSDKWAFAPTGGAQVIAEKEIPVTLNAGEVISISGAGGTTPAFDAISIRFQ